VASFVLRFSIRILPHKQNSGGFFVAVLHKKCSLRDVQNSSKSCGTVREPASDESNMVTSEPVVTQNDSAVLDHTCSVSEPSALDSAIVPDCGTSQHPVSDNVIDSGWFNADR